MPAPVPRSARQRALSAAMAALRRDGIQALTMRSVADEAGVTATALYRHFADKDQLVAELARETAALFRDYIGPGLDRAEPADRLLGILIGARRFAIDHPRYYELLFLTPLGPPRRYPDDFRDRKTGDFALLVGVVRDAMAAGLLRPGDPVDVALTLASHHHGLVRLWLLGRFGTDRDGFERFAEDSFTRILVGLAPRSR